MQQAQGTLVLIFTKGRDLAPLAGELAAAQQQGPGGGQGANPKLGGGNGGAPLAGYQATIYNGQLPAARGTVTALFSAKGLPATQRENAEALHQFRSGAQNDLRDLNGHDKVFTALVSIPASCRVKLLYDMGFGTAGIGQALSVSGKLLALYSRGGGILGLAQAIALKADLRNSVRIKNLTAAEIEALFQSGTHMVDTMVQ